MNDFDIIKKIKETLGVKLEKLDKLKAHVPTALSTCSAFVIIIGGLSYISDTLPILPIALITTVGILIVPIFGACGSGRIKTFPKIVSGTHGHDIRSTAINR